jgi:hypothetical protein
MTMTRGVLRPIPGMPAAISTHGDDRRLINLPVWVAGGLGSAVMLVRSALVLLENLRAEPGEWQGLASLCVILLATSVFVILACAAAGVAIGWVLQTVLGPHRRLA